MRSCAEIFGLGSSDAVGSVPAPGGRDYLTVAAAVVDRLDFAHFLVRNGDSGRPAAVL